MSLAIQQERVREVLLSGEWYKVDKQSFYIDSYEFMDDTYCTHGGGHGGVTASGFCFITAGSHLMAGPLTAIQAIRYTFKPPQK